MKLVRSTRLGFVLVFATVSILAVGATASAREQSVRVRVTVAPFKPGGSGLVTATVRPLNVTCRATVGRLGGTPQALPSRTARKGVARWQFRVPASAQSGTWVATARCARAGSASMRFTVTRPTPPPTDPVIAAAGDISCAPNDPAYNNGAGTGTFCMQGATAKLLAGIAGLKAVLPLGDQQYGCGELANYAASYSKNWGKFKAIEHPVAGNHEYGDSSECTPSDAAGYYSYFGSAAGVAGKGYYSYDIGTWHLIALNSNCKFVPGGCDVGSPQELWLKDDLAAHPAKCVLAYWHHPRWSAGPDVGDDSMTGALWSDLVTAHAELVLVGHDHTYQRYTALDARGTPTPGGLVQVIVGTGGQEHAAAPIPRPSLLVSNNTTYGVLKLTLRPDGYAGQFLPAAGTGSFADSFTGSCA
jgi:hypothetical protein